MIDDWFSEPKPEPTLHELYTRRLVAWGYLTPGGYCAWIRRESPLTEYNRLLSKYYIPAIKEELGRDLMRKWYGKAPWTSDPERKASDD